MRQDFRQQQVIVVGAGSTGLALCRYFQQRGAGVVLSDARRQEEISGLSELAAAGISFDCGQHSTELFLQADLVVLSPGVPETIAAVVAARQAGIPVLGEIEIAWRELTAPLIAITGTNGKSTTTSVIGAIFQQWGMRTFVGGNLGLPLIEATGRDDWDWVIAELSSFQLETIEQFRPRYALLLNITEDHLDRYPDMASYIAAKARIFENLQPDDVAILNAEDPLVAQLAPSINACQVWFSSARLLEQGMGYEAGQMVWRWQGCEERFTAKELRLRGLHNVENVMAALIPALLEGCPPQLAWSAACAFAGLDHRMVAVRQLDGVWWFNDSKGTNVGSVVKSLAGLEAPVTLIAGGKDKGGDYAPLAELVLERVAHLLLIGEASGRIAEALGSLTDTRFAATLQEAVTLARQLTPSGGAVLLSPGCSSFDMFKNYGERGEIFTQAVLALPEKECCR